MVVLRNEEEIVLEGQAGTPTIEMERIVPIENISDTQASLRDAWLKG
jgi:hypothetical protein